MELDSSIESSAGVARGVYERVPLHPSHATQAAGGDPPVSTYLNCPRNKTCFCACSVPQFRTWVVFCTKVRKQCTSQHQVAPLEVACSGGRECTLFDPPSSSADAVRRCDGEGRGLARVRAGPRQLLQEADGVSALAPNAACVLPLYATASALGPLLVVLWCAGVV